MHVSTGKPYFHPCLLSRDKETSLCEAITVIMVSLLASYHCHFGVHVMVNSILSAYHVQRVVHWITNKQG